MPQESCYKDKHALTPEEDPVTLGGLQETKQETKHKFPNTQLATVCSLASVGVAFVGVSLRPL
jgi:hypothetical protein